MYVYIYSSRQEERLVEWQGVVVEGRGSKMQSFRKKEGIIHIKEDDQTGGGSERRNGEGRRK